MCKRFRPTLQEPWRVDGLMAFSAGAFGDRGRHNAGMTSTAELRTELLAEMDAEIAQAEARMVSERPNLTGIEVIALEIREKFGKRLTERLLQTRVAAQAHETSVFLRRNESHYVGE